MTGDQTPPAGWYPDPNPGADAPAGQQRYWDGSAWTDQTTTAPTGPADPAAVQQAPRDGLGLAAFVLGVIGLILVFFIPVGILVTSLVAVAPSEGKPPTGGPHCGASSSVRLPWLFRSSPRCG
jgi:hypothetical protein